jgi:4-amino-4-deoxy-L-arabinose transferase-like glycosyltransferase
MAPVIPVPASAVHSGGTAPETAVPQTPVPQTPVPQTPVPQTPVPQTPVPQTPVPQTPVPQTPVPPGARRRWTRLTRMPWPLLAVVAAQSGLSLRLIWSNTAYQDEGLYLWTGHLEITHLLYHMPIPQLQAYMSGSPVIYPIAAAIADSYGGLAAARALSLVFMLAATTLLYLTASRLFGWRAGVAAAAVFAALGPVQALGAYATYDAMAIFLLALAAWLTVRGRGWTAEFLLLAAALAMASADATKYASALWNPVIISLAVLTSGRSALRSILRGLRLTVYTATPLLEAARLAGPSYLHGAMVTTIHRQLNDAGASVATVAQVTSNLIGVLLILGVIAFAVSFTDTVRTRILCGVLTFAALLGPLHQAQIHVLTSLDKHVAFGAWFCAIAAGYLLARAADVSREKGWRVPAAAAGIIAFGGVAQAGAFFHAWPSSAQMIPVMRSLVRTAGCPCLASGYRAADYYLAPLVRPDGLTGPYFFGYWDNHTHRELTGIPAYRMAIRDHLFHVVEIDPAEEPGEPGFFTSVATTLATTPGYRLVAVIPIPGWGRSRMELWRFQPVDHALPRRSRGSPS